MIDGHELCERTFRFACDVPKLCVRLQERGAVVRRLSMLFIAKNFISLKESRETRFCLRLIVAPDPPLQKELEPFLQEANEFIAMLTTSLKNARLFLFRFEASVTRPS
jgi:hypothetical protein